jgi:hypothetical protein
MFGFAQFYFALKKTIQHFKRQFFMVVCRLILSHISVSNQDKMKFSNSIQSLLTYKNFYTTGMSNSNYPVSRVKVTKTAEGAAKVPKKS